MSGEALVLEIIEGSSAGRQIQLGGTVELGRDPSLDVALDDDQVSRHHARVSPSGDGAMIEDLGSRNGTYVNDHPVDGAMQFAKGDKVRIGLTVLQLRTPEQVTVHRSAVEPAPEITTIGKDVLEVVPEEELAPVQPETPNIPSFRAAEGEPGFVRNLAGSERPNEAPRSRPGNAAGLARLVDARVKHQTNVAAFAFLAIAALVVLIYFGVR